MNTGHKDFFKVAAAAMWKTISESEKFYWRLGPDEPAITKISEIAANDRPMLMDEPRMPMIGDVVEFDWNNTGDMMLLHNEAELADCLASISARSLSWFRDYCNREMTLEEFLAGE